MTETMPRVAAPNQQGIRRAVALGIFIGIQLIGDGIAIGRVAWTARNS
jgi:hypothetical protein